MDRTRWTRLIGVAAAALLLAAVLGLPARADAWQAFAKIVGSAQGVIEGDATTAGFEKQIVVVGLGTGVALPIDLATGLPGGKLQARPLQIVKRFDKATPKLLRAVDANESLPTVEITLFATVIDKTGTSVKPAFKFTLLGARISEVESTYDPAADPSTIEKVSFAYTALRFTDLNANLTGEVSP